MFSFVVLVLSFLQKSNCLFWFCLSTFWCFVLLCSDLKVVFKRIIYPVLSWFLIQFGYHGFIFLSHAARLWCMVFSKLALVSLDYYIVLSNRVNRKFELCEICQS